MKIKELVQSTVAVAFLTAVTYGTMSAQNAVAQNDSNTSDSQRAASDKNGSQHSNLSAEDSRFVHKAACGGMSEVALGKLAVEKGSTSNIKQLGQHMVDDHSKANNDLAAIASRKGFSLPSDQTPEEMKKMDKLRGLTGVEFDNEYINLMTEMHKKDLQAFKQASASANDSDLKTFASNTEPVIAEHLKMLEGMPTSSKRTSSQ